MKNLLIAVSTLILVASPVTSKAGVSIDFDLRTFVDPSPWNGTVLFIAHGADNVFNSGSGWSNGTTSFLLGDDWLMGGYAITSGTAQDRMTNVNIPTGSGSYSVTQFTALYFKGLSSSSLNYSTGSLLSGFTFGSGGGATTYSFGSWRSSNPEYFGQEPDGSSIGFVIPSNSSTTALNSYTAAAGGVDAPANFNLSGSVSIVPEPSTGALMMIGAIGLVALRRLRKV